MRNITQVVFLCAMSTPWVHSAELRFLGKHGHGYDNLVPIRESSQYITDPAAYGHGLPPMAPFPEETALIHSEEVPIYGNYDDLDIPEGWEAMAADLPYVMDDRMGVGPSKRMEEPIMAPPPIKGAPLPPIMVEPPTKAPPVQPVVVERYAEPRAEPHKGKKKKGKHGHGGGHKKKKRKHEHEPVAPPPIVLVMPQKHVKDEIPPPPPPPMKGPHHPPPTPRPYHIPPYAPMEHEVPFVPAHEWTSVGPYTPDIPVRHTNAMPYHESGYRPVSKAHDPWN